MGSRRPKSAILAVFGGLEIGLRCARYAGWVCIRCIYDLRRPPGYSLSPQKSVKRLFRGQGLAESGFRVRHDAGVFRPNGRHQRNANGEKTLKPRSFGFWGGRTEKVEAKKPNRKSAKCAILSWSRRASIGPHVGVDEGGADRPPQCGSLNKHPHWNSDRGPFRRRCPYLIF